MLDGFMAVATSAPCNDLLDRSGLPTALTGPLKRFGSTGVAGGVAPLPDGATPPTSPPPLTGMHTTMLAGAVIAAAGALVALAVRLGAFHQRAADTAAADHDLATE